MNHLTISIPCYNDAAAIGHLIGKSLDVLSKLTDRYGVFVINDGSRDETSSVLKKIATNQPKVQILEHPKNLGFGPTMREAYTMPESEWVFVIPGDGQIPPSEIFKLYPHIQKYSFILGHRKHRNDPWMRKFNSWGYNWTISLIAGRRVHDVNSVGLLQKKVLESVPLKSNSAFIHAEIFLRLASKGVPIAEIEISHKKRLHGAASGNKWKTIFTTIQDMIKYL